MQTGQSLKGQIPYNLITTSVFLSIVVVLPLFLLIATPTYVFITYGAIPLICGLWTFLREPDIQIKYRKMQPLSEKYPSLVEQIIGLKAYSDLRDQPEFLYIPSNTAEVFAFGTWRKKYFAISEGAIANSKSTTISSVITHEIAHLRNGDTWKTGFPTHFLYWLFLMSILIAIRSFPYSLFFKIYDSYRADNGISDMVVPLLFFILGFAVLLATRFLYRMKEFSADSFAQNCVGLTEYVQVFLPTITTQNQSWSRSSFESLGFHPSKRLRLQILQEPLLLVNELPNLMFIIGLFLGYASCYRLDLDSSFALAVISEFTVGVLASLLLQIILNNEHIEKLVQIKILSNSILNMANGMAFAFIFLVGISNLMMYDAIIGSYFRRGDDLLSALFSTLDITLLILIFIPALILGFVILVRPLIHNKILGETVKSQILFVLVAFLPGIALFDFYISQWWEGIQFEVGKFWFLILISGIWVLVTIVIWRLFAFQQRMRKKVEK